MKKTLLALLILSFTFLASAQSGPTDKKKGIQLNLTNRPADHLMIQYGLDSWSGKPDSVRTSGFSRHFNVYLMLDKPFKSNPKYSIAYGVGIGSSNIFFNNTKVDIRSNSARLPFTRVDSTDHFKKYKVTNIYVELPVEIRYYSDPANPNKSFKAALGVKVGSLLKTYTKGKDLLNKNGSTLYGPSYISKESNKSFFNGTMIAVTGRVGLGFISLDAGYQINGVLKDGTGAPMNKFSLGITFSGL